MAKQVATASLDSIARIWTAATGELTNLFAGHAALGVNDVDFSPDVDAHAMVTAGADGTASYSALGQRSVPLLGHDKAVSAPRSAPTAARSSQRARTGLRGSGTHSVSLSRRSSRATAATSRRSQSIRPDRGSPWVWRMAVCRFSPQTVGSSALRDGDSAHCERWLGRGDVDGRYQRRARADLGRLRPRAGARAPPRVRNPSCRYLAGWQAARDGRPGWGRAIWRLPSGTVRTLKHDAEVKAVDFDETGKLLASASGKQAFVWRTSDAERINPSGPKLVASRMWHWVTEAVSWRPLVTTSEPGSGTSVLVRW